jgi:hypothetical protein
MAWPETAMMVSTMPMPARDHKAEIRSATRADIIVLTTRG